MALCDFLQSSPHCEHHRRSGQCLRILLARRAWTCTACLFLQPRGAAEHGIMLKSQRAQERTEEAVLERLTAEGEKSAAQALQKQRVQLNRLTDLRREAVKL